MEFRIFYGILCNPGLRFHVSFITLFQKPFEGAFFSRPEKIFFWAGKYFFLGRKKNRPAQALFCLRNLPPFCMPNERKIVAQSGELVLAKWVNGFWPNGRMDFGQMGEFKNYSYICARWQGTRAVRHHSVP